MTRRFVFNRLELSGSLGDLGALLPIAIAMILIVGLNPTGLLLSIGLFYIFSGSYFGVTVPVQPMKVIGAYAVATAMQPEQILSSSLLMALCLLIIALTGAIDFIRKHIESSVIKGVQLATGILLIGSGIKFILGKSQLQIIANQVEPNLQIQSIGPIPISIILGILAVITTLMLLDSKKYPAGIMVIWGGIIAGLALGARPNISLNDISFHLPEITNITKLQMPDLSFALFALVIPQLPMTLGNAVISYADLSEQYFHKKSSKVTYKAVCISMALANFCSFFLGGMPLCHGAGGLAAHYRFGARTPGSNIMIGFIFVIMAIALGGSAVKLLGVLPLSVLGAMLIFAGTQLALSMLGLKTSKECFVAVIILAITLATNLAYAFIIGIILAKLLKSDRFAI
ncbi:MAG: putative sulfate/molybdate transporter [Desulfotalea sp.]